MWYVKVIAAKVMATDRPIVLSGVLITGNSVFVIIAQIVGRCLQSVNSVTTESCCMNYAHSNFLSLQICFN